jgi:hypothetical protein
MAGMSQSQEKVPERLGPALKALEEGYKEILRRSGIKDEASLLAHAAAVYGMSRLMVLLLGSECEEQVARSLELSTDELRYVADYIGNETKEDHRRLLVKLTALEALLFQIAASCKGAEN